MTSFLNRYATPALTGLFLVSLISGVALFFHWNAAWFHSMHEWISILLIVPFVLHLWKNWRPMTAYFRKPAFRIAMALSAVAALVFVWPALGASGTGSGGPPQFGMAQKMLNGSVAEIAAVLDESPAELTGQLEAAGFTVASPDESLSDVAGASRRSGMALMAVIAGQG